MMVTQFYKILVLFLSAALCYGDEDSCPECMEFSCKQIKCTSEQYCILQAVECISEPCPKLPTCISASEVCESSSPYIDEAGGIADCTIGCPLTFQCVDGFCCTPVIPVSPATLDLGETDADTVMNIDGAVPPPIFHQDLFGEKELQSSCKSCENSLCLTAICPKHIDAVCVYDNCTCVAWFTDAAGEIVDCTPDVDDGVPPILFPSHSQGGIATQLYTDPSLPIEELLKSTTERGKKSTKTVPPVGPKNPSTTIMITLESKNEPMGDDSWKYAVAAVCGVLLCIIGFMIYKFLDVRQKHKSRQNSSVKLDEEKAPLSKVSSENNNESKSLVNEQPAEDV